MYIRVFFCVLNQPPKKVINFTLANKCSVLIKKLYDHIKRLGKEINGNVEYQ